MVAILRRKEEKAMVVPNRDEDHGSRVIGRNQSAGIGGIQRGNRGYIMMLSPAGERVLTVVERVCDYLRGWPRKGVDVQPRSIGPDTRAVVQTDHLSHSPGEKTCRLTKVALSQKDRRILEALFRELVPRTMYKASKNLLADAFREAILKFEDYSENLRLGMVVLVDEMVNDASAFLLSETSMRQVAVARVLSRLAGVPLTLPALIGVEGKIDMVKSAHEIRHEEQRREGANGSVSEGVFEYEAMLYSMAVFMAKNPRGSYCDFVRCLEGWNRRRHPDSAIRLIISRGEELTAIYYPLWNRLQEELRKRGFIPGVTVLNHELMSGVVDEVIPGMKFLWPSPYKAALRRANSQAAEAEKRLNLIGVLRQPQIPETDWPDHRLDLARCLSLYPDLWQYIRDDATFRMYLVWPFRVARVVLSEGERALLYQDIGGWVERELGIQN